MGIPFKKFLKYGVLIKLEMAYWLKKEGKNKINYISSKEGIRRAR